MKRRQITDISFSSAAPFDGEPNIAEDYILITSDLYNLICCIYKVGKRYFMQDFIWKRIMHI